MEDKKINVDYVSLIDISDYSKRGNVGSICVTANECVYVKNLFEANQQLKQKIKWYEADAENRHLIPLEEKLEIVQRYHKALNELVSADKRIDETIKYIDEVKRVKQLDDKCGLNSTFDLELNLDNIKQILKRKEE